LIGSPHGSLSTADLAGTHSATANDFSHDVGLAFPAGATANIQTNDFSFFSDFTTNSHTPYYSNNSNNNLNTYTPDYFSNHPSFYNNGASSPPIGSYK